MKNEEESLSLTSCRNGGPVTWLLVDYGIPCIPSPSLGVDRGGRPSVLPPEVKDGYKVDPFQYVWDVSVS